MARTEARLFASMWDDDDVQALEDGPQLAYIKVLSQRDLEHDGVIALRPRRWAKMSRNLTGDKLCADLRTLDADGFFVIDWETEELFVRSLLRRDRGYKQLNILKSAADHLTMVLSPRIRAAMLDEVVRILGMDDVADENRKVLLRMVDELTPATGGLVKEPLSPPTEDSSRTPVDGTGAPAGGAPVRGSVAPSRVPQGEGGEVTVVTTDFPYPPAASKPQPSAAKQAGNPLRTHARGEEPPPDAGPPGTAEQLLGEWKGLQRRPVGSVVKAVGMWIHGALGEGHDPDDIRETLRRWDAKDGKGPGLLPSMLNEVVNGPRSRPGTALAVVNGGRSGRVGRSTTDDRVAGWLALRSGT